MHQSDTRSYASTSAAGGVSGDYNVYYLIALGILLAGYAVGGKMFAYIRIPPVFIGDIVFALGIIAFLKSRCAVATLGTLPSLLLGVLIGWVIARTLPYLGEFGIDALRDSAIVVYGGFAFIVVALLLERPERLPLIIHFLRVVGSIIIVIAPILLLVHIRAWSTDDLMLLWFTPPGVLACHLTGAALLILLGFREAGLGWRILLLIGIVLVSTATRGGMFAIIIPLLFAVIASGKLRELFIVIVLVVGLVVLAYGIDPSLSPDWDTRRDISPRQLIDNFASVIGASDGRGDLAATKNWRLEWWKTILNYTFEGSYFWAGKGFGVNLSIADGFGSLVDPSNPTAPPLRAPHSCHFTILARAGVPGLALWLLTLGSWSAMLLGNMVRARMRGDDAWANFFILVFCYALSILIDGSFSLALEGPMQGIWFWALFGVGIGASMIYRTSLRSVHQNGVGEVKANYVGIGP